MNPTSGNKCQKTLVLPMKNLRLTTTPPPFPCVRPKRHRLYVQNVPMFAGTTRTCVSTCARGAGTHVDVLNVHTGFFQCVTQDTRHETPHNNTQPQDKTSQDKREERRCKTKDKRQDKKRGDKMKRREEKIKRREEKIKKDMMCCVCGCVVLTFPVFSVLKITRPSNNFEFSTLPLPPWMQFNFSGKFLFVQIANEIVFRIILVIILAGMVPATGRSKTCHGTAKTKHQHHEPQYKASQQSHASRDQRDPEPRHTPEQRPGPSVS